MIVCVCRRVSDRDILRHAQAGLDFENVQFELGIALQCGRCEGCARDLVARCASDGAACQPATRTGAAPGPSQARLLLAA